MIQASTLKFLKGLAKNNNKPWFDAHRADYEAARRDFENFLQRVIDKFSKTDPDLENLVAKNCLYRINRDIRFSKDKTPYKRYLAGSLDKGGKNSGLAGYYFHLEPGESFLGAGIWNPPVDFLRKIRQEIDYGVDEFEKILKAKKFKAYYPEIYTGENVQMKKVPQGFEKDNPAAEYLKFRSWMIIHPLDDATIHSKELVKVTCDAFVQAKPFVHFINRPLQE